MAEVSTTSAETPEVKPPKTPKPPKAPTEKVEVPEAPEKFPTYAEQEKDFQARIEQLRPGDTAGRTKAISDYFARKVAIQRAQGDIPIARTASGRPYREVEAAKKVGAYKAAKAASPPAEVQAVNEMKRAASEKLQDQKAYLQKVAERRGLEMSPELLTGLVDAASRPVTPEYGYDPSNPLYDPEKEGFDMDAMEAVNIWAMATYGKRYASPQKLRENLGKDRAKYEADLAKIARLHQEAARDGEEVVGVIDGEVVGAVKRAQSQDTNKLLAEKLPNSVLQTLVLTDMPDEAKAGLKVLYSGDVTEEDLTESLGNAEQARQAIQNVYRTRKSGRVGDYFVPLLQTSSGYAVNSYQVRTGILHNYYHELKGRHKGPITEDTRSKFREEASKFADRQIEKMKALDAPVFHSDPTGAFKDLVEGKGIIGNVSNALQWANSFVTLGLDEVLGDIPDKAVKSALALLLPRLDVSGVVYQKGEKEAKVGEAGFVGHYLGENPATRAVDWFFRLAPSEAIGAAYGMAFDEVLEKHGTVDGHAKEIASRMMEVAGTDEHLFRIASRDDDFGTMMMTYGRALDPLVLAGAREESSKVVAGTAALGMMGLLIFEPDAFTLLGPAAKLGKAGARATKLMSGLDNGAMFNRAMQSYQYGGATGAEALTRARIAAEAGDAEEASAILDGLTENMRNEVTGAAAAAYKGAELNALRNQDLAGIGPGRKSGTIVKQFVDEIKETDAVFERELARLNRAIERLRGRSPELDASQAAYRDALTRANHERGAWARLEGRLLANESRTQAALDLVDRGGDPVSQLKRLLNFVSAMDARSARGAADLLDDAAVRELLTREGLDAAATAAEGRRVLGQGDAALQAQFVERLQQSLTDVLGRSADDLKDYIRRPYLERKAQLETQLRAARDQHRAFEAAMRTAEEDIRRIVREDGTIDELFGTVDELRADLDAKLAAVTRGEAIKERIPVARKRLIVSFITELEKMAKASEAIGEASYRARGEIADELSDMRRRAGETVVGPRPIWGDETTVRRIEEIAATRSPELERFLDDLQTQFPDPAEYKAALVTAMKDQRRLRETMFRTDSFATTIRNSHTRATDMALLDVRRAVGAYYWVTGSIARFLAVTNIRRGVVDITTNDALKRIASRSHSRFLALGSEFNEWINNGDSALEGVDRFKDLAEQYLLNPGVRTVRTSWGQEMRLVAQSGMADSLFDEAAQRIKSMVRLGPVKKEIGSDEAEYSAGFVALVKSLGPDELAENQRGQLNMAIEIAADKLDRLEDANFTLDGVERVIRGAFKAAGLQAAPVRSASSYAFFYKNLIGLATDERMIREAVAEIGDIDVPMVRSMNYFMSEGMGGPAELIQDVKVGDKVVPIKAVREFNEIINIPMRARAPKAVAAGYEFGEEVIGVKRPGLYEDPRVVAREKEMIKEGAEDLVEQNSRSVMLERLLEGEDAGIASESIVRIEGEGTDRILTLRADDGTLREAPANEFTLRDGRLSVLDGFDGVMRLGLAVTAGKHSEKVQSGLSTVRREYQYMVARSMDAEGNINYLPRDFMKQSADRIDRLEKDVFGTAAKNSGNPITQTVMSLVSGFTSFFKQSILFGIVVPRAAYATAAIAGDTGQLILHLGVFDGLRLGTMGALGYIPFVGRSLQESAVGLGAMTSPAIQALLRGEPINITLRDGTVMDGRRFMQEALEDKVGDNILSPDALEQARKISRDQYARNPGMMDAVYERATDYRRLMEIQMREATRAQRLMLYADARINRGLTRNEAADELVETLYDWDSAASAAEAEALGQLVLFYTFMKNAMVQVHRSVFEGYSDDLGTYMSKFARGQTKMQRIELMTRLTHAAPTAGQDPTEEITAEKARELEIAKRLPTYLSESTIFGFGTLTKEQQEMLRERGTPRMNYAHALPKLTPVEMLSTYVNFANVTMVPAAIGILNMVGATEYEMDGRRATKAFIDVLLDTTGPVGSAVLGGTALQLGLIDVHHKSDYGRRVSPEELPLFQFLGLDDTLVRDPRDGSIRVAGWTEGGDYITTAAVPLIKTFMLPEYIRARTLGEIAAGGPLTDSVAEWVGANLGLNEDRVQALKMGPAQVELTRAEQGEIRARMMAIAKYLGAVSTYYYSGDQAKEWSVKNAKKELDKVQNMAKMRERGIIPGD